jgi:hypothetical protein
MRLITGIAIIAAAGLLSCQAKQDGMEASRKDAIIDSIVGSRMEEINRQAMEDLDRRKSIEVKAKADSIVAASITPSTPTHPKHPAPADHTMPENTATLK